MFRRSQTESTTTPSTAPVKEGGKGRPTPTRKEAQAAAKARAKQPRTRKELAEAKRKQRVAANDKVREAMKTGDDRYLPARDRGPVRRFVRDFVDARFSFSEILIPLMIPVLLLNFTNDTYLMSIGSLVMMGAIAFFIVDSVLLHFRLRSALKRQFPDSSPKGQTLYAVMRAMQVRFLRLPKPQKKIGQPLDERYR